MSHYNFLNIGAWNIQGLFSYVNKTKLCKLEESTFLKRISSFEIFCLQETQCGISETNSLSIEGYRLIPFQRKKSGNNRYFGGSLLLIKNEIRSGIKIIDSLGGLKSRKSFLDLKRIFTPVLSMPPL